MLKKICFMQYNLLGGGAERRVCTLANYFVEKGYPVDIGLYGVPDVAYELDPRVKVTFIRRNTYEYRNALERLGYQLEVFFQNTFMALPAACVDNVYTLLTRKPGRLKEKVERHYWKRNEYTLPIRQYIKNRPDAVFVTMMVSNYLAIMDVIEEDYQKTICNPFVVMDCSDPKKNATPEVARKRNKYYPMAARSVVQTQGAKDYFPPEVQKNMVIIPNPVKMDLPEPYVGKRTKTVVNYCRLTAQKNLGLLIDAFSDFHKTHPEYQLHIYGEGELRQELVEKIQEMGLSHCAAISNFDAHIHEKIVDAGMYVSTSDWEGFPNSLLEALSIGLPCISTDCDFGPRDLIENNVNGILIPMNDRQALYEAMCRIAEEEAFAKQLGEAAIKTREIYSADKIGQEWLRLLQSVAEG